MRRKDNKEFEQHSLKLKISINAFTLIELLAVIIILGLIILIAIPSVTYYINDSKKKSYIISAKELINSAINKINSGEIESYDLDTTYYVPVGCLNTENEITSPFGKFAPAYVIYTYTGDGYNYYWTSTDESYMGIVKITSSSELDISNIKPGSKPDDINTDRTVDGRKKIVVYDSECKVKSEKAATIYGMVHKTCNYNGELTQGAEFVDGQYVYRYKQEGTGTNTWGNISDDGWGVMLANKNSTDPVTTELCTSINGKKIVSMRNMFYYSKASSIDTHSFDTSSVKNMSNMFYYTSNITSLDIDTFYTSNVTNMSYMFGSDYYLKSINIGNGFNTSNVTTMKGMFSNNNNLKNVDFLKNFDVSKVKDLSNFLYYCYNITDISGVSNWDVSNVNNLDQFMYYAYNIKSLDPLSNWDVSNVTTIKYPFYYSNVSSIEGLRHWNLKKLSNWDYLFYYMVGVTDLSPILEWDTSKITSLKYTFAGLRSLQSLDSIKNLNISNVKSLYGTFSGYGVTDITALKYWNMANVETMDYMFSSASKVADFSSIKQWYIPKVKSMKYMFSSNSSIKNLNQFNNWNLSNVSSIKGMFSDCYNLTDLNGISTWSKPNLTDMSYLFSGCSSLTNLEGLRYLNLENVTNISFMFFKCSNLSNISPLVNWNVSKVTNMAGLFGCEYISNPGTVKNWNIDSVVHPSDVREYYDNSTNDYAGFSLMFKTTRRYLLQNFSKKNGCWAGDGTFIPGGSGSVCNTNDRYSCGGGCLDGEMLCIVYDEEKKKRVLKKVKDIKYSDLILVWNFDKGKFEWARPLWIMKPYKYHESVVLTFDDGTIFKAIGDHKIFNEEAQKFTSARFEEETPIGMHTINSEGKRITLVNREIVREDVYAYNIITDKHINLYTNGILSSRGSNNIYPIKDMKFVKETKETFTREELKDIPDEYFYGLRLDERSIDYCGTKDETIDDIKRLVDKLIKDKKED